MEQPLTGTVLRVKSLGKFYVVVADSRYGYPADLRRAAGPLVCSYGR